MKTEINHHLLTVPLEFSVACTVYKLDVQEVLQIFIDHSTIYDSLADTYNKGFSEASKTIGLYVVSQRRTPKGSDAFKHCLASTANCFKRIADIANGKGRSAKTKRSKTAPFVNELYATMERVYTKSDLFYLDENTTLKLSKDFTILCELHNCYPAEYLEDFMGKISLADMEAKTGLNIPNANFTMAFFANIVTGFGMVDDDVPELNEKDIAFLNEMEEMRIHIRNVRHLEQRIKVLKEFYHSHYLQMTAKN